ncbi:MAG: aminotransferase class IV [Ekhidna sp.]|uniref:aminotransferase class IV n=1 Tax=Ekhidna sp. TaxID=2608089 RepID=UPI0032EC8C80
MRFIESILLKDGEYKNLSYHQQRMDHVFEKFAPKNDAHNLSRILPHLQMEGVFKVRIVYDMDSEDAEYDIEYSEYQPRKINTLEVVHSPPFDYSMKYENRTPIAKLLRSSQADDIIIAMNGSITDGSYFNLAFWNGNEWLTPDTPLLKGVRRTQLLAEGKIKEAPIRISELGAFEKVSLINAMLDLSEVEVPLSAILKR